MSQVAMASSRELALERRKAMSTGGKAALKNTGDRTASSAVQPARASNSSSAAQRSAPARTAPVATTATSAGNSTRLKSLARRKAMSTRGKSADTSHDRTRTGARQNPAKAASQTTQPKKDCGCGCGGAGRDTGDSQTVTTQIGSTQTSSLETTVPSSRPGAAESTRGTTRTKRRVTARRPMIASSTAKTAALSRRKALSSRGKAGLGSSAMTEAQAARASNPKMTGRELAQVMREQRSKRGSAGQKKSAPCGKRRKASDTVNAGAAQDAPWKVGASETTSGQTVTGTMVGRKENMTGDEASTCRSITGTEYMGADIFSKFCQTDVKASTAKKVTVTSTSHGNPVSGNRMGRSTNVTGNEPGTCKNVTGNEYISAEQQQGYCGEFAQKSPRKVSMAETMKGKTVTGNNVGRSESVTGDEYGMRRALTGTQYTKPSDIGNAPSKVGTSATLRGGSVTGTMIGRREKMTGDEPGSCRNVTGDDYIGQEQYSQFCDAAPQPKDKKVEVSQTMAGRTVTGSLAARSQNVTGDEPGTCKAVTGTPYASSEQYRDYCEAPQQAEAQARMKPAGRTWGKPMTGQQPSIAGVMTGDSKGACETVSGTPYVGADQAVGACPATAAEPGSPDFPQALVQTEGGQAPWDDFSVKPPMNASYTEAASSMVTGSQYERGDITGPFGMATGKVTGTEQARFDRNPQVMAAVPETAENIHGRVKSRITGEGQDAGLKITGDDWDRNQSVTGTEGASAARRNPTLRGGSMNVRQARADMARAEDVPMPVSKVTGSSGNTEKGSLITYSGGARG